MTEEPKQELEVWRPKQPFEGTDMVPKLPNKGVVQAPPGGLKGRENVDVEDMVLPALQLLQGQSDAVTDGVDGAKPGLLYLPAQGLVLEPPLRLLLVHHGKSRALFPKAEDPRSSGLKKCLSRDTFHGTIYGECAQCPYKDWTGDDLDIKPLCSESHNFTVWTDYGPAVLRFANSSYRAAKDFLTTWITTRPQRNLWAHPVVVHVKKKSKALPGGKDSTYFVMEIRWDQDEDVPPAFQLSADECYEQIKQAHEAGTLKTLNEEAGFEE
jgi:hypothetical protein